MTDFSVDERNAMRSYLQRSEVRLSTMHRVASAFLGGAGLLILFPVFFNQAISTLTSVLIRGARGHLVYSTIFLSVPLVLSVFIPLYALYFLLRDLVHFYFVGHSPGFPTKLFNPRFVLSGILFSPDESESVKHEVYVNQYGSDLVNFVVPFGEPQANYYSIIVTNTRGQILPEERKVNNLMASQVIRKDTESGAYIVDTRSPSAMLDADDIDRFNAAFGLAGARDRHLVSEVAKMEASLVRHAIGLRRLLLRYVKALLMFILTALVSFTIAALLLHATDPASINTASDRAPINILIVSVGYLIWAPLTVVIVRTPVKWIYRISSADAENIVQRDPQLVEFEKKVLWLAWVAGIAALCAAATLFLTIL